MTEFEASNTRVVTRWSGLVVLVLVSWGGVARSQQVPAASAPRPPDAARGPVASVAEASVPNDPEARRARTVRETLQSFDEFQKVRAELKHGLVVLSGTVPTREARDALGPLVRAITETRHVWNRTTIAPGVANAAAQDAATEQRLNAVFANVEELESVRAKVSGGVVKLSGRSASPSSAKRAADLADELPNTLFVENDIEITSEVPDRVKPTLDRLEARWHRWAPQLPLFGVALLIVAAFAGIARLIRRLHWPFRVFHGRLAQDIARRLIGTVMVATGLIIALELLDATALVGAVFGAAGVAGVVLGFAFRDIVENYLASILLSLRRPFSSNEHVVIGAHEGKVVRLTSRDTILMTLDGNHLRLPNAAVFKAEILNYTRNPMRRFEFEVGLGVNEDITAAVALGVETLQNMPGTASNPPPFARVDALGDSTVVLKFFGWVDQRVSDWYKVRSEAVRRVKVALDAAEFDMPAPSYQVTLQRPGARQGSRPVSSNSVDHSAHEVGVDDYLEEQIAADREHSPTEQDLLVAD